jgi:hypothetical protein
LGPCSHAARVAHLGDLKTLKSRYHSFDWRAGQGRGRCDCVTRLDGPEGCGRTGRGISGVLRNDFRCLCPYKLTHDPPGVPVVLARLQPPAGTRSCLILVSVVLLSTAKGWQESPRPRKGNGCTWGNSKTVLRNQPGEPLTPEVAFG